MNQVDSPASSSTRFAAIFSDLVEDLKLFIRRHGLSYEEYHQAVEFIAQAGTAGEMPLLVDLFLETVVDDINHGGGPGTQSCLEGPYYIPGTPLLEPPYALPQRDDEPGQILFFSGTVRSTQGVPLVGALLDLWQADASGMYSQFDYPEPRHNLRGRLYTDDKGRFEVRTVVPASYSVPTAGPTGSLLTALGRQAFRPAHLHVKLSHEGFEPLTTQLFMEGDPLLGSDAAGAVKASLIATLARHDSTADLEARGLDRPYFCLVYDFTLAPPAAAAESR